MNDSALLVNFLTIKRKASAPVFQNQQAGVEGRLTRCRHIADAVNRLVNTGIGVEVTAKLHTQGAGVLEEHAVGEVLRAIEGHVLKEVGQAAL